MSVVSESVIYVLNRTMNNDKVMTHTATTTYDNSNGNAVWTNADYCVCYAVFCFLRVRITGA